VLHVRFTRLFERGRETRCRTARRFAVAIPAILLVLTMVVPSFAEKAYKMGPEVVAPKVLEKQEPQYTPKALEATKEGTVVLIIVVGTDQRAHDVKVTKSLDPGLDANVVKSIKTWRFQPGTKGGKPVPVLAVVEVNFRLK
jgi:TonB family protein